MKKILICDDEKDIVSALDIYLKSDGYKTVCVYNGFDAVEVAKQNDVDLILLDVMMPKMDGIAAMSEIRKFSNIPIILLTAKSEDTDKILGLNVGADDYVTKPFNPVELLARVRSQIRRYTQFGSKEQNRTDNSVITIGGISLNDKSKEVFIEGEKKYLTPTEYDILKLFMQNPNVVMSPKEIYKAVWQDNPYGAESTVAVHIRHLREKIEINSSDPRYIKVVWAKGYKFEDGKL